MNWTKKDLLGIRELSKEEILLILDTADSFKDISKREVKKKKSVFKGKKK